MNALSFEVVQSATGLPVGSTDNSCACPKCGKQGAFSITRFPGQLKFICFRVGCGFAGTVDSVSGESTATIEKVKRVKLCQEPLDLLNDDEVSWLSSRFRIPSSMFEHVRWGMKDQRVYYPQYNVQGRIHGYIARAYPELGRQKGPKAMWRPLVPTEAGLCFPDTCVMQRIISQHRVLLVEDYPSAMRVNYQTDIPCCCLGGTAIYPPMIDTMLSLGVEHVIIVLDADAIVKATKIKRDLSLTFDKVSVIPLLGPDLKDLTRPELDAVLTKVR